MTKLEEENIFTTDVFVKKDKNEKNGFFDKVKNFFKKLFGK